MADSDVTLKVGLDVKDVESQAQQLRGKIENVFDKTNGKKMSSSFVHLKQSMRDLHTESTQVSKDLTDLTKQGSVEVQTKEYARWAKEAQKVGTKLQELQAKLNYFRNMPGGAGLQKPEYATTLRAFNKYQTLAGVIQTQMKNLEASGKKSTMVPVEQTQRYQDLIARQSQLNDKMQIANLRAQEMQNKMSGVKEAFTSAHNAVSKIGQAFRRLLSLAGKLVDRLRGVNTGVEDTSKSMKNLLKFALKYGLGLRSLFILYKRLRSAGVEAYKGLASQFPELQAELNDLRNSFFQLKNSLATMAQPILSYLVPAIKTLMSWLTAAMNAIANFFAILTGAKYIYKASKANKDWAKSAGGAGKAAKEASEDIAEYDNLILIQQDNDNGGGGGGGATDDYAGAFEKVKAESDLAQEIKDAINRGDWEGVGSALAKRLNKVTQKLDTWINSKFRPAAKKWASRVARILNGFTETWDSGLTGKTLADGLMSIYDAIATFYETYNFKLLGKKIGTAITSFFTNWEPETVARKIAGKFNAIINFVAGLIDKEDGINFKLIGSKLGQTLKNTIERIDWKQLGADLSGLATGILEGLASFIKESKVGTTVGNAINQFLSGIDFGTLAKDLSELAINIMSALADALETIDWTAIGQAIADFLKNIDWGKFLSTLVRVAVALVKGIGTALLQIATDPEALGSLATGLLAIFGAKFIWSRITGLFSTGLTSAITSGAATAGGGGAITEWLKRIFTGALGTGSAGWLGSLLQGAIAGAVTYQGVGSASANVMSVVADLAINDPDLTNEYQEFAKNPMSYTKTAIEEGIKAAQEESYFTEKVQGKKGTILGTAIKGMFGKDETGLAYAAVEEERLKWDEILDRKAFEREIGRTVSASEYLASRIGDNFEDLKKTVDLNETSEDLINFGVAGKNVVKTLYTAADEGRKTITTGAKVVSYADTEMQKNAERIKSSTQKIVSYADTAMQNALQNVKKTSSSVVSYADTAKANAEAMAQKNAEYAKSKITDVKTATTSAATAIKDAAKDASDSAVASANEASTKTLSAFDNVDTAFTDMSDSIKGSVSTVPASFESTFTSAYNKVKNSFSNVKTFFSSVAEGVKSPFGTMADYFKTTFSNSWNNVVSVFQSNSPQFQSIQDTISGSFKGAINSMITGINNSITGPFNSLASTFTSMRGLDVGGVKVFKNLPYIRVPSIPKLAQGAVIPPNKEFIATLGDQKQGTNIETPLATMIEAFETALQRNGDTQHAPIVLQLNGRQVAQVVWDEENKRYKQTGMRYRTT